MANLNDIVTELQTTNAKVERVADILEAQRKQDQAQEDAAKREKTAKDEADKKAGKGITGTISSAFKSPKNGFKKVTSGFLDPLKNFFEILLKSFVIDFFSDPEKMRIMEENLKKFGTFLQDTYNVFKGFIDTYEKEGLLAAMNETFGPGGTILAAVAAVTAIGVAVSTVLAPLRIMKKGFSGLGKLLAGAASMLAGMVGLAPTKFLDPDKVQAEELEKLKKTDTGPGSTRGSGKNTEFLKKDGTWGKVYEADGKTVRGAAKMAMQSRDDRLTRQASQLATERLKNQSGERTPQTKDNKMLQALKRMGPFMKGLGLLSVVGTGYSIYDILDNDKISYPEKEKMITTELMKGLGGFTGALVGGAFGTAIGGPFGGLAGMIGGGYFGNEAAAVLANYIMTGNLKPPIRPQSQIDADLGFQEDLGLGTNAPAAYVAPTVDTSTGKGIFTTGPQPTITSSTNPVQIPATPQPTLSPDAIEMVDNPLYHKSWDALNKTGMFLNNDTAIQLLKSIDDHLKQYGIGGNVGVSNVTNVGNNNYVMARGSVNTSDPNR